MNYIMGIDIGSTHIKVGIYNTRGTLISISRKVNKIYKDKDGNSFYKPDRLVKTVYSCINETIDELNGEISLVCVAGMAESGLMIDKDGAPLNNIIPWFDGRNKKELSWCKENFDPLYIYENTGLKIQAKSSLLKIMWIKENEKNVYDKCSYWLGVEDYIIYCLTGEISTEISLANRTMAMDIRKGKWHEDIIKLCGIRQDIFPEILPSGFKIGKINKETAEITGIREGTPVLTGGHDHLCAAIAFGAIEDGMMLNSMGTAESLVKIKKTLETTQENLDLGFSVGRYVLDDLYYVIGGINNSGGAVSWFGKNILGYADNHLYKKIKELERNMNIGATGILFLPHLAGSSVPVLDNCSRGSFVGLKPEHTNSDLIKSIYEGLSCEFRILYETMKKADNIVSSPLIVTGGSTKNDYWMQIKADILNKKLNIPCVEEAVCMGAAVLGALGLGIYSSINDVSESISYDIRIIDPAKDLVNRYNDLYNNAYKKLYKTLIEVNRVLTS